MAEYKYSLEANFKPTDPEIIKGLLRAYDSAKADLDRILPLIKKYQDLGEELLLYGDRMSEAEIVGLELEITSIEKKLKRAGLDFGEIESATEKQEQYIDASEEYLRIVEHAKKDRQVKFVDITKDEQDTSQEDKRDEAQEKSMNYQK